MEDGKETMPASRSRSYGDLLLHVSNITRLRYGVVGRPESALQTLSHTFRESDRGQSED